MIYKYNCNNSTLLNYLYLYNQIITLREYSQAILLITLAVLAVF